jgi:hypothetical protein
VIEAQVYVTDAVGTLAFDGVICKRGPRPGQKLQRRLRHCCTLGGGSFAGKFTPIPPHGTAFPQPVQPPHLLYQTGNLTAFTMGASCRHATLPVGAVSVHEVASPSGAFLAPRHVNAP